MYIAEVFEWSWVLPKVLGSRPRDLGHLVLTANWRQYNSNGVAPCKGRVGSKVLLGVTTALMLFIDRLPLISDIH